MLGHPRSAWHLTASVVLAALLSTVPLDRISVPVVAFDGCTVADEVRGTTCRLLSGATVEGVLDAPGASATYRVDVFAPDTTLDLVLAAKGGTRLSVLDWRGSPLGATMGSDDAPAVELSAKLPLPGAYGVRVTSDAPAESPGYRLTASVTYATAAAQPIWPAIFKTGDGPFGNERQVVRVPRGGTPAAGVAASRILSAPPDGIFADFTMVADVRFEKIVGPSALTVRFRYEPEAGGGTGYILSVDPFGGTVTLDGFEEGQRRSIVGHAPLAILPTSEGANRLVLTADGPAIRATLDGRTIVEASDGRFSQGLVAVGAVTWSDPVAVTFEHIQVTTPPR